MKKMISTILAICMVLTFVVIKPVYAIDDVVYVGNGFIQEMDTGDLHTKEWLVVDGEQSYDLFVDYEKRIMKINDEIINIEVEEIELPLTRTTVDYSSVRNFKSKIPWKGSVTLLAAGITAVVGGGNGVGWAATIASALTADAENVWVTFAQYASKETYYSSYHGMYYKKCINKNITFYKTSVSKSNIIYGPVDGGWFDPVRPE